MQQAAQSQDYQLQVPTPETGESYERYAIRAHRALRRAVSDPDERNALVEELWREQRGPTEAEQRAASKFNPEKYVRKTNVCYFLEHETVGADGKPKKYDLAKLVKIIRNANDRISERGAFPGISDGHTPPPERYDLPKPPLLGYVGNYRLGQMGWKKPVWAIFADEYHDRSKLQRIKELPRRSVELWTFKDTGQSHFDPVAALGSEAPRLALPLAFSALSMQGAECERYSFEAAAMTAPSSGGTPTAPGGSNTYAKGFAGPKAKRKKYQQQTKGATGMTLPDQDLAQIVNAINNTPEFAWIRKKMQEDMADDQAEVVGDQLDLEGEEPEPELIEEPEEELLEEEAAEEPVDEDIADIGDLLAEEEVEEVPEPDEDEEPERMSANNSNQLEAVVEKYNALSASHAKLLTAHQKLHTRLSGMEKERSDAQRRETIRAVAARHPGMVDEDEEFQVCLYSAGSEMTDEQFKGHVATIEKFAARALPSGMVPGGVTGDDNADLEKYEAALSERAVQICTAAVSNGREMSWDEGLEQAKKEILPGQA